MPVPEPVLTASGSGRVAALTVRRRTQRCRDHGPARPAARARGAGDLLRRRAGGQGAWRCGGAAAHRRRRAPPGRARDVLRRPRRLAAGAGEAGPAEHGVRDPRRVGRPAAPVPWFRAPNGSWGCSARVAAELGLQPLGVTGTIDDWRTQDVPTLVANLRRAIRPGGLVLAHDGGGDRWGTVQALAHGASRVAGRRVGLHPSGAPGPRPAAEEPLTGVTAGQGLSRTGGGR